MKTNDKKKKNDDMRKYRKDKRIHSITLINAQDISDEDFIKKNNPKATYVDIYRKGIKCYKKEIENEQSNKLEFKYKKIQHEMDELQKRMDIKQKELDMLNDEIKTEKDKLIDYFFELIEPIVSKFMKDNEVNNKPDVNVTDLYKKYSSDIERKYTQSGLTPSLMGKDSKEKKEIIIGILQLLGGLN